MRRCARRPKQRRELAAAAPSGGGAGVPAVLSRQRALDRGGANAAGNHYQSHLGVMVQIGTRVVSPSVIAIGLAHYSRIQLGDFPELFLGAQ